MYTLQVKTENSDSDNKLAIILKDANKEMQIDMQDKKFEGPCEILEQGMPGIDNGGIGIWNIEMNQKGILKFSFNSKLVISVTDKVDPAGCLRDPLQNPHTIVFSDDDNISKQFRLLPGNQL